MEMEAEAEAEAEAEEDEAEVGGCESSEFWGASAAEQEGELVVGVRRMGV